MNAENSTGNPARLPLWERAASGALLADPELTPSEVLFLEHPTDKAARLALGAALQFSGIVQRQRHETRRKISPWFHPPGTWTLGAGDPEPIVKTDVSYSLHIEKDAYRQWRLTCPQSLLSEPGLSQIEKWLGNLPAIETSLPAIPSLPESEPVTQGGAALPGKRQRIDALGNAIQAALAVLSPSGKPLPRSHELFEYLKTSDSTRTITGIAKGNRALLWIDDNGNEQTLTFPALTKRLDRLKQGS